MLKGIRGFDPMGLQGPMKNEFAGTGARPPMDSYHTVAERFEDLIRCRYPDTATVGSYKWHINDFRRIAELDKLRRRVNSGELRPEVLPEREEGARERTMYDEITSRTEQLRDLLRQAHDDVVSDLESFDADLPGNYDSKEFWLAAAQAYEAKTGAKTVPDFSEDLLDDEARALLLVGREVADPYIEGLAELAVLNRFAELVTDNI